jgi:hypothetical protein
MVMTMGGPLACGGESGDQGTDVATSDGGAETSAGSGSNGSDTTSTTSTTSTGSESSTGSSGGSSGATGSSGSTGSGSSSASGGTGETGAGETSTSEGGTVDEMPWFSFFVVSLPAIQERCGNDGCGGDLGGLAGADAFCSELAALGNPTDSKTWRAFLSTTGAYGDMVKVDAVDRIGDGPWWSFDGRMLAPDLAGLMAGSRPEGGDPSLSDMFTDELGEDIQSARNSAEGQDDPDNHDSVTGSDKEGRLFTNDEGQGRYATCEDWTSDTLRGPVPPDGGPGGIIPVGHAWPRGGPGGSGGMGAHWVQDHFVAGCERGINTGGGAGATDYTIGSGGGYGQFYCFALDAEAPP